MTNLPSKALICVGCPQYEGYEFTSNKPVVRMGGCLSAALDGETNSTISAMSVYTDWCEQILGEMAEHYA